MRLFLKASRRLSDDALPNNLNDANCATIFKDTLTPAWSGRLQVLEYCQSVANSLAEPPVKSASSESHDFNPRVNPYQQRDYQALIDDKYTVAANLQNWINTENAVESITIGNSLGTLADKCQLDFGSWKKYQ